MTTVAGDPAVAPAAWLAEQLAAGRSQVILANGEAPNPRLIEAYTPAQDGVRIGVLLDNNRVVPLPDDMVSSVGFSDFDDRGRLDTSYGTAGIVEIALNPMSYPAAIVTDQLDRTTVAGVSDGQFFVTRVDQNGRLDTNFGSQGITLLSFAGPGPDGATSIVADTGGHSVVAGYAFGTTYTFALARLSS